MSKLTKKLILMFVTVILVYAVILVYNFSHFTSDVLNTHHVDVILRGAENVAETFESFLPADTTEDNFLDKVQSTVNIEYALEMVADVSYYSYSFCDLYDRYLYLINGELIEKEGMELLPEEAEVVKKALAGDSSCYEVTYADGHIIVGAAPIHNAYQEVVGIILIIHQDADSLETQSRINNFLITLTSITLLILVLISTVLLSHFTAPIRKITHIADELAHGNLDIETNIHQNDEIGQLAYSMDQLTTELRKSKEIQENEIKIHDKFLADISHELKTPVTVMRGSLEALVDGVIQKPEDVAVYYQQMLRESNYLQKLIQDLLMISTLKIQEFKIKEETIDLSEVMSDTAMSVRSIALAKGIRFVTHPPKANWLIVGEYELIRKLLMLILDNAIKYTDAGKSVYYYQTDNGAIVIKDEGRGIDQADIPYIFDRFYRHDKGIETGSSGLGLAIAKEIAKRHQIEIRIESVLNEGTCFTLVFNAHKSLPEK